MTFYQNLAKIREQLARKTADELRYSPTAWVTGDIITAVRLNKMEDGIEDADEIPLNTVSGSTVTQELSPNEFYVFGEVSSLTLTFAAGEADVVNEYHFRFESGSTPTTLDMPVSVEMPVIFNVEANMIYEISVIDNLGVFNEWPTA